MKKIKSLEKISLLTIGTTALTLGSTIPIYAQIRQGNTIEDLNLRTGPSSNDSVLLNIKSGSLVEILNYYGDWAYIRYENKLGYVSGKYIKEISNITRSNGTPIKNPISTNLMVSNTDSLNIRRGPSRYEQVVGHLKKGSKVEIVYHTSRGWSRVKYNNSYGYVSSQYLSTIESLKEEEKYITMHCNSDKLNIRKGPSTKYSIIGNLNFGDKIDVISHLDNNWSKIKFNGEYAYVSTLHLSDLNSNLYR